MTFKKFLRIIKNTKGQAALEYFLLSAMVGGIVWAAFINTTRNGKADNLLTKFEAHLQVGNNCFFQKAAGVNGINVENE